MSPLGYRLASYVLALLVLLALPIAASAQKRVALVIGNSAYQHVASLPNPVRDATAVADLLRTAGFNVVETRRDLGIGDLRRAISDFMEIATGSDVAVVFFAGHGIEVDGVNYLIPVDGKLSRDLDVEDETVSLDRVLKVIEPARRLRLVILDACRDNPFLKSMKRTVGTRSVGRGLGRVEPTASDTLVAFAARAGSIAYDGDGGMSPFTSALIKHLAEPGLDLRLAFGRVRDEVLVSTGNRQEPFVYGSLGGATVSIFGVPGHAAAPSPSGDSAELMFWRTIAASPSKADFEAYLRQFPNGVFADLARNRIAALSAPPPAPSPALAPPRLAPSIARPPVTTRTLPSVQALQARGWPDGSSYVRVSPDGRLIAGASSQGEIKIWNAADRELLHVIRFHKKYIDSSGAALAFSPNGQYLASIDRDGHLALTDVAAGRVFSTIKAHKDWGAGLAFTSDGTRLVTVSSSELGVWSVPELRRLDRIVGDSSDRIAISPDGSLYAFDVRARSGSKSMEEWAIWDTRAARIIQRRTLPESVYVRSVAFTTDGRNVLTGRGDGLVELWEARTGRVIWSRKDLARYGNFRLSDDGMRAVSQFEGTMLVWDVASGRTEKRFEKMYGSVEQGDFRGDLLYLAQEGTYVVHDLRDGSKGPLPAGATASPSVWMLPGLPARMLTVRDKALKVTDLATARETLRVEGVSGSIEAVTATTAVVTSNAKLTYVDLSTGAVTEAIDLPTTYPSDASVRCIFGDLRYAFVTTYKDNFKSWELWDIRARRRTATGTEYDEHACAEKGSLFAINMSSKPINVYDAATGRVVTTIPNSDTIFDMAFSHDTRELAVVRYDGPIEIHDPTSGRRLRRIQGDKDTIYKVTYMPGNREIIARYSNDAIKVLNASSGAVIRHLLQGSSYKVSSDFRYITIDKDMTRINQLSDAAEIARYQGFADGTFVVITRSGYGGSPEVERNLRLDFGTSFGPVTDEFIAAYRKPDLSADLGGGR